jgi:hypothetical protein
MAALDLPTEILDEKIKKLVDSKAKSLEILTALQRSTLDSIP